MSKTVTLLMISVVALVSLVLATSYDLFDELYWLTKEKVQIDAKIKLVNNCEVPSSYFAIKTLDNGRSYSIAKGETTIKAIRGEKMQLVLSPKYKDVEYDGMIFRADTAQTVYADCSFGERQQGVTDGLRNTFSN
jgi:hypothetical protein